MGSRWSSVSFVSRSRSSQFFPPLAILNFLIGDRWDTQIPIVRSASQHSAAYLLCDTLSCKTRLFANVRAISREITRARAVEMNFPLNLNSGRIRIRGKGSTNRGQRAVSRSKPRLGKEKLVDNFHGCSKLKKFLSAREDLDCFLQSALIAPAQECDWSLISRPPLAPLFLSLAHPSMKSYKRRPTQTRRRSRSGIISRHYPTRQDRDLNLNDHSLAVLRGFADFCQLMGFDSDRNYLANIALW